MPAFGRLFLSLLPFVVACGSPPASSPSDRPAAAVELALTLAPAGTPGAPALAPGGGMCAGMGLTVTAAAANVERVALRPDAGRPGACGGMGSGVGMGMGMAGRTASAASCMGGVAAVLEGPFRVDLLTGVATPTMSGFSVPAGTYDFLELHLAPVAEAGDPMLGFSVDLHGTYARMPTYAAAASGASMPRLPVHVGLDLTESLRLAPPGGIVITAGAVEVQVAMAGGGWLASLGAAVARCAAAPDAPLVGSVLQMTGRTGTTCDGEQAALRESFLAAAAAARVTVPAP